MGATKYKWDIKMIILSLLLLSVAIGAYSLFHFDRLHNAALFIVDANSIVLWVWERFAVISRIVIFAGVVIFILKEVHKDMKQSGKQTIDVGDSFLVNDKYDSYRLTVTKIDKLPGIIWVERTLETSGQTILVIRDKDEPVKSV